ncbi:MAG: amidohydrolase [Myxococcales bacterium]|nr:amidohydrolase [Myxococcales bacterium]
MATRAIDGWVNVSMGEVGRPDFLTRVATDTFKQGDDFFRNYSIDEMLEVMDEIGVEKAILTTELTRPSEHVLSFTDAHPDRFAIGAQLDPRGGMKTLRALQSFSESQPLALARITPFLLDLPPNHAVYYPVYAKCIELELPITINTGIPGPPVPGECQHPMFLDRVCLHFPELKLVMAHGADPWWNEAIRLMIKYRNLYLMTSAYLPKYFPPELLRFMNTRGRRKILFASDHPVIQIKRCVEEAERLDLRPGVLDGFLYENAARLFFPDSVRKDDAGAEAS